MGDPEPVHLYDNQGHHLFVDPIPDPGTVDVVSTTPMIRTVGPGKAKVQSANAAQEITGSGTAAAAPTGALNGKIAYMNAGHGWTRGASSWATQRPEYTNIVEDFQTQDQMTYYADYMLRAGATVVPTRPVGHQLNEVIVDNHDAGFSVVSGSWQTNSTSPNTFWSNVNGTDTDDRYRFASSSTTETAVARFTPNLPQAGFYPVYAWWNNGSNRSLDATFRINGAGGSQEVKVNQRFTGKGWVYLGNYYFEAGTGGNVEVSNKSATANSVIIADAIRFGNGMGDWTRNGTHPASGRPREEELSLYWLYRSRGYTNSNAIVDEAVINGTQTSDGNRGIVGPPRWISYMNDEGQGTNVDRLHLSFHSNGFTGNPDTATARGTEGLLNNDTTLRTVNQSWWAGAIGGEVEEDMQALPAGMIEHTWGTRNDIYQSSNYGEISEAHFDAYNTVANSSVMAATILEVAFHDNIQDSALMRDPKVRDWVARASYHAAAKYFTTFAGTNATFLPEPPRDSRASTDAAGNVTLNWTAPVTGAASGDAGAATGYKIYYGSSGYSWSDAVILGNVTSHTFAPGTLPAGATYFRIVATNAGGESAQRDVVAAKPQTGRRAPILIVNGFDRLERTGDATVPYSGNDGVTPRVRLRYQNTRDYVAQFGEAIEAYNPALGYETAQNEQVASGVVNLANYHTVLWISGEESVADQTFTSTERSLLTTFLNSGGKLFTSGAEIGFHLDQSAADPAFYNNLLRADYVSDDANSYSTSGVAGSIFNGLTAVNFDNGASTNGSPFTYDVDTPDVIAPVNGATAALNYSTGGAAAVQFSSGNTRVVTMGFPFETIVSATKRNQVMSGVLGFFGVNDTFISATPGTPDLVAGSDTGPSSTDNLTNRNNGSAGQTLQFSVSGTVAGATVSLYVDGTTLIGSAVASGTTTVVTTNGAVALSDGARSITAKQTQPGYSESPVSANLNINVDTVAPTANIVAVSPDPRTTGVNSISIGFTEAIAGFDLADLSLTRDGGANLLAAPNAPVASGGNTYTLPSLLGITSVSGAYSLLLTAAGSGITDGAGNTLGGDGSDAWVHALPAWLTASAAAAVWNSQTKSLALSGPATITADPATDAPLVTATGASAVVTIDTPAGSSVMLGGLSVTSNASVALSSVGASRTLVVTSTPTVESGATFDLGDNAMILRGVPLASVRDLVISGFANGTWNGTGGFQSSSAANDTNALTTLAYASNADLGLTAFGGVSGLDGNDVIVKYTYYGDADLSGNVTLDDYSQFLAGFQNPVEPAWIYGDFDYSGTVTLDDYSAFLFAFQNQGAAL